MAALSAVAALACVGTAGAAPAGPVASLSPAAVDFGSLQLGEVGAPVTVTLSNAGAGSLAFWRFGIATSSVNPSDFAVVAGGTCSVSVPLASGESCTVLVFFKPKGTGSRSGLLSFWDNTPAGRTNVALSATGLDAGQPSLSPSAVDFGSFQLGEASAPVTVTLSNTGAGSLAFWRFGIATSSINPTDFAVVAGGTCSVSVPLAAGQGCTVLVRFKPTGAGARSGLLSFWDNTAAGRINVALSATGLDAGQSSLSPSVVDFGWLQLGEASAPVTVTLSNAGAGSLALWRFGIATSSVNASDFAVVAGGTCSVSVPLASGESCTVLVRFKPTPGPAGSRSGLLSFWDNTPAGRTNVALGGILIDECAEGCF